MLWFRMLGVMLKSTAFTPGTLLAVYLAGLLAPFLAAGTPVRVFGPDFDRSTLTDFNTDIFPRDELSLPALWEQAPSDR